MKRGRRVGEHRKRRQQEYAKRRAADDLVRQRCAELDASVRADQPVPEPSVQLDAGLLARFDAAIASFERTLARPREITSNGAFANAEHIVARDATAAETALHEAIERLRTRDASRNHVALLARVIADELGQVELAIRNEASSEHLARRDRLRQLGRLLLEIADTQR